jgi:filamentous hemagglutinin family protein
MRGVGASIQKDVKFLHGCWKTNWYRLFSYVRILATSLMVLLGFSFSVFANPQGGQVTAGSATISSPNANTVQINQSTDKAVIDWRTFNIAPHETTQFKQPSSSSITLNRIDPNNGASSILGRLQANGNIWLINPAGIFFGPTARVDVGGLLATTANISNQDFMAGNYRFVQSPDWSGAVINEGTITVANKGLAALVAPGVENRGVIKANLGKVVLAAGTVYTLDLYGDGLIQFAMDERTFNPPHDKNGKPLKDSVRNSGKIIANGGTVLITAQTGAKVVRRTINMDGYIQAKSAVQKGGTIILLAGNEGNVHISGKLNASGKKAGHKGGKIIVSGKQVVVTKSAKINASGNAGGGEILIGGDYQGKNSAIPNAKNTYIAKNAELNADAIQMGNGGKVIVWADDTTQFYGNVFARGGKEGGDGGFVEVSGKEFLHFNGIVNTLAPLGKTGTLLLDPRLITVAATGSATLDDVDSFTDTPSTDVTIAASTINDALSNVVLQANRDIRFNASISMTGSGLSLTAQAGRDIIVDNIGAGNISIQTNNGDISFTANDSNAVGADRATGTGDILMNAGSSIDAGTGNVLFTVGSSTTAPFSPGTITLRDVTGNDVSMSTPSTVTLNGAINAAGVVTAAANTDDSGAQNFTMNAGSSITTTNTSANAINITVNNGTVGTGNAFLRTITTQNGGTRGALNVTVEGLGDITLRSDEILTAGTTNFSATDAITFEAGSLSTTTLDATGSISILTNTNGLGTNSFTMNTNSQINTTDTTANAVVINVNTAIGGAGSATLSNITTGSGGTINVATNTGNNLTGGDILYSGTGSLDAGTGTVILSTPKTSGENIATSLAPIEIKAGILNATAGNSGIFITNTGTGMLTVNTLISEREDTSAAGPVQLISNTALQQGSNPVKATTLTLKTLNDSGANITFNDANNEATTINFQARNLADTSNAAGTISYQDIDGVVISGINTASTSNLTIGGSITQSGVIDVTGVSTFTLTAASSDITLDTQANNFGSTPVLTNNGNIRDLRLRNTNAAASVPLLPTGMEDLELIFDNGAIELPSVSLTATLTATASGAITQTGAISGTTLTAKTLNDTGSNITLNESNNEFSTINLQSRNTADTLDSNGIITYQDATGFNISGLHTTNNASITAAGAITDSTTTGTIIGGTLTLAAGATNSITLDAATNDINTIVVTSANSIDIEDANSIILGNIDIANNATITANGTITDSGTLTIPGNFNLSGTDITLNNPTNNFDTVAVSTGNNVLLIDTDAITLGTSSISGTFNVTAGGSISQSGALTVTGLPTFTVTAANSDILLATSANNFSTTPVFSTSGVGTIQDLSLRNISVTAALPTFSSGLRNVTLTFNNAAMALPTLALTGTLTATAGDAITQTGGLSGTTLTVETHNDAGADITLAHSGNEFANVNIQSRNAADNADADGLIQYQNASGFNITGIRTTGNASLTSSGDMTDSATMVIGGTTTLSSGSANDITLNTASNNFGTVIITNGNNVTLRDTDDLVMGASTVSGALSLTADNLTQSGALSVTGGTTTLIAGSNNITFDTAGNDFSTVAITSGNNVDVVDANTITLGTSTVTGTLDITAGGSIDQTGVLTVTGIPTFTVTVANSDILLATSANNFNTTPVFTNNGNIQDLALRNTNGSAAISSLPTGLRDLTLTFNNAAIAFPAITLSGNLTATSGDVMTQTGALAVPGTTTLIAGAANDITLSNTNNNFGTIAITSGNNVTLADTDTLIFADSTVSGALNTTTNGAITQSSGELVITGSAIFSVGNANDITLDAATNNFSTVNIASAKDVILRDANAIILGTSTIANDLTVTATSITQNGVLSGNKLIAKTLNNAGGAITLDTFPNDFATINLTSRNAADTANDSGIIAYQDSNGFDIEAIATTSASVSALNLIGSGNITDSGALTVNGTSTIAAGSSNNITLDDSANNFGTVAITSGNNINLVDTNALILGTSNINGTLNVTTGGAITDSGTLIVNGVAMFSAGLSNNISLNEPGNDFSTVTIADANDLTLVDINALNLGGVTIADDATLTVGGTLTDSGALTIPGILTIIAGSNNVVLDTANNNFGTATITSANDATLVDSNALILGASNLTGWYTVTAGDTLSDSGNISVDDTLTATVIGGITLNNAGNTINNFNPSNSGSGGITLVNTASPLTITGFTHTGGGGVNITNTGIISVANGVTINTGNAALTLTATDLNLNSTGAINSGSANTTITQDTGGGSIGLGNTSGTMTISGGELQRITSNNLMLDTSTDGQILVDGISEAESNNITNLTLSAISGSAGSILFLNNASNFKSLAANADDGITVSENLTATAGDLILNADVNGAVGTNDMLTLNANLMSAGSLTLSAATGGIALAGNVNLTGSGITINDAVNGTYNLTLNAGSSGDINLNANIGSVNRLNEFNIMNMNNLFNTGLLKAASYTQTAGNLASLGNSLGLDVTGTAIITGSNVTGAVNVGGLALNTSFANLTGFVDGFSGRSAIEKITILNTISAGTHFFDGIDMFTPQPSPTPPPSPAPFIVTEQGIIQYIFPPLLTYNFNTLTEFDINFVDFGKAIQELEESDQASCVNLGSHISICSSNESN